MGEEVKTDVGVMKSETRQLDADSKRDLTLVAGCFLGMMNGRERRAKCEPNCMHCMEVYDTLDNWIIKAHLTKAGAPPPAERRCQRSVTSCIYVH